MGHVLQRASSTRLFSGESFDDHSAGKTAFIKDFISKLSRREVLDYEVPALVEVLYTKWEEVPVSLDVEAWSHLDPTDVEIDPRRLDRILSQYARGKVMGTLWTFTVPFQGGLNYLEMRPSGLSGSLHGEVVQAAHIPADVLPFGELHFKYETLDAEPEEIERQFKQDLNAVVSRFESLKRLADTFNNGLRVLIQAELQKRRERVTKDAAVSAALSIPLKRREGAPKPFSVPIRKKIALVTPPKPKRSVTEEWALEERNYEMILDVLRDLGHSIERTASAFERMKEPHLRDIILFVLNGHFKGEATGETFNGEGKADIVMRWNGKNAFLAECKYWDGRESLLDAIAQLGGYACWSDTKATLLIITKRTKMSTVLAETRDALRTHPKARGNLEERDKNEFRIALEHPTDEDARLAMTVLVYNVRRARTATSANDETRDT